jgi:nucleoside phosphorylase
VRLCIQICSNLEWRSLKRILAIGQPKILRQSFAKYFEHRLGRNESIFFHSGDTKTRSAAASQFAIDTWYPDGIVNLGTCGGVAKKIKKLDIIMARKTVQYDCIIRFGEAKRLFYRPMVTKIDTSWVDLSGVSTKIYPGTIATADQDLDSEWREKLQKENVLGADWESGAISKVCELNEVKCLILRGVTDIPNGTQSFDWKNNTPIVMRHLLQIVNQIRFLNESRSA